MAVLTEAVAITVQVFTDALAVHFEAVGFTAVAAHGFLLGLLFEVLLGFHVVVEVGVREHVVQALVGAEDDGVYIAEDDWWGAWEGGRGGGCGGYRVGWRSGEGLRSGWGGFWGLLGGWASEDQTLAGSGYIYQLRGIQAQHDIFEFSDSDLSIRRFLP